MKLLKTSNTKRIFSAPSKRLLVPSDLSMPNTSLDERRALWSNAGLSTTLRTVSHLFAELDLAVATGSRNKAEMEWTTDIPRPLRSHLRKALRKNLVMLSASTMLQATKEIIEFADEEAQADLPILDLVHCLLGINNDLNDASPGAGTPVADIESVVTLQAIAQQSFNSPHTFETLASEVDQNWLQPWPTTTGAKVLASIGDEPHQIFNEVVGTDLDEFLALGWNLYNMVRNEKKIYFGEGLFISMNLGDRIIATFMERCTWKLSELRELLARERDDGGGTPWTRYYLQMKPFVVLPNGGILLLRLQYLVQRFMGEPLVVDVNEDLKSTDKSKSQHFRNAVNHNFEKKIGNTLDRIADSGGLGCVITEDEMISAFQIKKGANESICDYAFVSDDICVLIDANNRHLMQGFAEGTGTLADFEDEIKSRFSEKKFMQLKRTIEQFRQFGWGAENSTVNENTVFVPLVVGPEDGIPSNNFTERLIMSASKPLVEEFDGRALPPTIITWRDLRVLEGLVEKRGANAAQLLLDWRQYCVNNPEAQCALELYEQAVGYDTPLSEFEHKLGFDFFEKMRSISVDRYIERLPTHAQAGARQLVEQERRNLPTEHL